MSKLADKTNGLKKFESMNIPLNKLLKDEGEMRLPDLRKLVHSQMTDVREVFIQNVLVKNGISMYRAELSREAKDVVFDAMRVVITKGEVYDCIYINKEIVGMWRKEPVLKMTKKGKFVLKVTYWAK